MKNLAKYGIPITLDRTRTLLLDEEAFHLVAKTSGVNVAAFMAKDPANFDLTLNIVRALLWAGLRHEDRRLTFEKVCMLVNEENYEQYHEAIFKAICRGLNIDYTPEH